MGPRRKTQDMIIEGSLALFNQLGAADVSTNHIAQHLEISPGNLYYYFANKEAIIRAIFGRIRTQVESLWADPGKPAVLRLTDYVNLVFHIIFSYRFFFSELTSILRRDEALRTDYTALQSRFKEELATLLMQLQDAGILKNLGAASSRMTLANSVWIVAIYWHSYLESAAQESRPSYDLLHHIVFLLTPYIEESYLDVVKGIFTSFVEARRPCQHPS